MREENLAGESFSSGKLSTGDVVIDTKRAKLMEEQVLAMLERQEKKQMMPVPEEKEATGLWYYCQECRHFAEYKGDPEKDLKKRNCEACQADAVKVSVGPKSSLINRYKIRLES